MDLKVLTLQVLLLCGMCLARSLHDIPIPCNFPAIFNFGSSSSDTGQMTAAFGQLSRPNGDTYFGAPAGRHTDGRLVIDFISESLGFPYLSPYLESTGSNFTHGVNFASAGATIRPQNITYRDSGISPFYFDVQRAQFSDFMKKSPIPGEQGMDYYSRALYTMEIGSNDLTANITGMPDIREILRQFSHVFKKLYGLGGRTFWIHNHGPLGCVPLYLSRLPEDETRFDRYGCFIPYNDISKAFNLQLKRTVSQLRAELPLATITYVDMYSARFSLIRRAEELGFEKPLAACCGDGVGKYNVSGTLHCGITQSSPCDNPSARINWDGIHYTEAANHWVFKQIVDGSFSDPPVPLKDACNSNNYISTTPPPSPPSPSPSFAEQR